MSEEFKKWLCDKAGISKLEGYCDRDNPCLCTCADCDMYHPPKITLEILIKAMWAINREKKWIITMDEELVMTSRLIKPYIHEEFLFTMAGYEQQSFEAALKYIWEQEK